MKKCLSDIWKVVEAVDKCHRGAMVANVTGGAVGMAGGVAALAGLLLAPTMLGTSLVLSAVGFGISTVGGLTSATATISDSVNSLVKKGEVETLVEEFQRQVEIFTGSLEPFKTARGLLEFLGQDESTEVILGVFRVVGGLGRSVLNVTSMAKASTVLAGTSHAVRFAGTATHILVGLSLALDLFFVTKDSVHFHHGARSELAKSIRAAAATLEREFNIIDEFCEKINRILEEQE
ncbi:apolipoprotein L1-like isoform X2 [Apteryx rowi]|nr:apolipoprotein L1-like isoform X2 [Apteryx rowi]